MALGLEQSHSPRVQDSQAPQACNGRQGTVGQDQTLKMDEFFPRSPTTEDGEVQGKGGQSTLRDVMQRGLGHL